MSAVWDRDITPASCKLIALKLADFANDAGERVFPSLALVAAKTGVSIDTARRAIGDLRKLGVLRLVRSGGSGPRSTNEYAFDLAVLATLPIADIEAETDADPAVENPVDEAAKGGAGATLGPENKGSNLPPLDGAKGSTQPDKGGTHATQTVNNQDITPNPADAGNVEFVEFEEFETIWPWYGDERRDTARSAWDLMDETNRRGAVDHVPRYLAEWKAGRTRRKKSRFAATAYLRSGCWLNRKAAVPTVRREAFVVRGTPAWDYAMQRRSKAHCPTRTAYNPDSKRAENGWSMPIGWFDTADLPDEIAAGQGRDWWINETNIGGEAAA